MAKDIRDLFDADNKRSKDPMPNNHEARFLSKLEKALPQKKQTTFNWLAIAASIVVLLGVTFGGVHYFKTVKPSVEVVETEGPEAKTKTLGDISPDLKKVEDYYVAHINLELSKMKLTPENKELFDGYLSQLENLKKEYKTLSLELTKNGPDALTVDALINNLKFRLNLMYRLKEQLKQLNTIVAAQG
ncbi:hypothetical protein [Lacinutrix sp. Hel_I_90]|uniref:hypothetical protein n=1 Tax=Lacinutrix sp. Hel_I_90 TaxID=1249999 RepID=UPI0005CAA41A|nr:hypothetical protein [Lacinutrix sp. Hel_I_90]